MLIKKLKCSSTSKIWMTLDYRSKEPKLLKLLNNKNKYSSPKKVLTLRKDRKKLIKLKSNHHHHQKRNTTLKKETIVKELEKSILYVAWSVNSTASARGTKKIATKVVMTISRMNLKLLSLMSEFTKILTSLYLQEEPLKLCMMEKLSFPK